MRPRAVRFVLVGGCEPMVDMRSLAQVLGVGWPRWEAWLLLLAAQQGWTVQRGCDAAQRATWLMWATDVPRLLQALAALPQLMRRPLWLRVQAMAAHGGRQWRAHRAPGALDAAVTAPACAGATTAPAQRAGGLHSTLRAARCARVTKRTQEAVQALAAQGRSDREIAQALGISRSSASLLRRGLYVLRGGV